MSATMPMRRAAPGFLLQAAAGWQLANLDINPSTADVFWPMALQGFGGVLPVIKHDRHHRLLAAAPEDPGH